MKGKSVQVFIHILVSWLEFAEDVIGGYVSIQHYIDDMDDAVHTVRIVSVLKD